MGQNSGLNLKDVVRHLPRGDASLRGMDTPHGVQMKASQLHKVKGRSASGDRMILPLPSMSEVLVIKTVLLSAKQSGTAPPSTQAL